MSFDKETATPGDAVSISTRSVPESFVLLSVVDSSLHLLSESCKSSSSDNVRESGWREEGWIYWEGTINILLSYYPVILVVQIAWFFDSRRIWEC